MSTENGTTDMQYIERFLTSHHRLVERMCLHASFYDINLGADLVQECYAAVWRRRDSLRRNAMPWEARAWLVNVCRSAISNHLRRERSHAARLTLIDDYLADTLAASDDNANAERLEELAVNLDVLQKTMLGLIVEGYTTNEIADRMHLSAAKAKALRRSLIDNMRETLLKGRR